MLVCPGDRGPLPSSWHDSRLDAANGSLRPWPHSVGGQASAIADAAGARSNSLLPDASDLRDFEYLVGSICCRLCGGARGLRCGGRACDRNALTQVGSIGGEVLAAGCISCDSLWVCLGQPG